MRTLFLDFGKIMGYAIHDDKFGFIVGEAVLPSMLSERYKAFYDIISRVAPDCVGYEKVNRHLGTDAAHQYGAYEGITMLYCEQNRLGFIPVYVMSIKAYVGCARADKESMRRKCIETYNAVLTEDMTHNAVDAFIGCLVTLEKTNQRCVAHVVPGKQN